MAVSTRWNFKAARMGRPVFWTKWRVQRKLNDMTEYLRNETDPKTWTLSFKELLIRHELHSMIFRDWGDKFGNDPEISLSVFELKEILEARVVSASLREQLNPWVAQFILKNNYGYSDDPAHSAREDDRLEMERHAHSKRLSEARHRGELEGPRGE